MTATTLTPANASEVIRSYGGVEVKKAGPLSSGLVLGIYAPGGVGKTTVAASITDSELGRPAFCFNARGNPFVVASKGDVFHYADITRFSQIEAIRAEMANDPNCPYKSLVYDTVTEMHSMRLIERYGTGEVTWDKHSATTGDILTMIRQAVGMAEGPKKMNVIFVFQETQEDRTIRGQKGVKRSEIAINRACQDQIPGIINWLGRLYITESTPPFTRMLDFTPIETEHQAKMQKDRDHELMKAVPFQMYDPSLASLLDTFRGGKPWPTEKHARPGLSNSSVRR